MHKKSAFTTIEIVTVMGILLAMSFFVVPIFITQLQASRADSYASEISANIFLYQQNAFSSKDNLSYGIKLNEGGYELFTGSSYATGTVVLNIIFPANIQIQNIQFNNASDEIVFAPNDFMPSTYGSFEVADDLESFLVEINSEGFINYRYNED